MAVDPHVVTTRQRAFLEAHGLNPDRVMPHAGLAQQHVELVVLPGDLTRPDGRPAHPWADDAELVARSGRLLRYRLPYPDQATRDAAEAARNGDWEETVGPEAAAIWRRLVGQE